MLTEKEIEVLKLRKRGLKQSEIALRLKISQPAVSFFMNNISKKILHSVEILDLAKSIGIDIPKLKKRGRL